MICFTTTILTLRVYGALFTLTANQMIVVSGVDEQPMTGTRKKADRTKSKRRYTPNLNTCSVCPREVFL